MDFDLENPFFNDLQQSLFDVEIDHLPLSNKALDSDPHLRRHIIQLISLYSKKHNQPFVSYLAMTYLHRFLASHSIPGDKPYILKLVAVSCVSIALKMIIGDSGVQRNDHLMLDVRMVERMEYVILGALQWRTRLVTPFAFIKFFLSLFKLKTSLFQDVNNDIDDHHYALKDRATEIIFKAQIESKLLDFKPSIIAASALLCASHELYPLQFQDFKNSILSCVYVNEDELSKCECMIQELMINGYESMLSCKTPINVLDLDYSSSEDTHTKTKDEDEDEKRGLKRLKISTFAESPFHHF